MSGTHGSRCFCNECVNRDAPDKMRVKDQRIIKLTAERDMLYAFIRRLLEANGDEARRFILAEAQAFMPETSRREARSER